MDGPDNRKRKTIDVLSWYFVDIPIRKPGAASTLTHLGLPAANSLSSMRTGSAQSVHCDRPLKTTRVCLGKGTDFASSANRSVQLDFVPKVKLESSVK